VSEVSGAFFQRSIRSRHRGSHTGVPIQVPDAGAAIGLRVPRFAGTSFFSPERGQSRNQVLPHMGLLLSRSERVGTILLVDWFRQQLYLAQKDRRHVFRIDSLYRDAR
jgi:hypothetical protein